MRTPASGNGHIGEHWHDRRRIGLAVGLPLAVFVFLAVRAYEAGEIAWETSVADFLDRVLPVSSEDIHIDPYLQGVTIALAALTAAVAVALAVRRQLRAALFLVAAVGGVLLMSWLTKATVRRPPIEGSPDAFSFPSGSAAWSMATAAALLLLADKRRTRVLLAVAGGILVVGLAATIVFEEWHYPSDILGAWCLALGWVAFLWLVPFGRPRAARTARDQGWTHH